MDTCRQAIIANISGRRRRFRRGVQDRGEEEELEEEEATSITSWVTNSLGGLKREIVDTLTSRDSSARWLESIVKGVLKEKEENRMLDPAGWGLDGHKEAVKEDKENEEDKKDKKEKEDKEDKEDKEEVGENDERCIVLTWRCLSQVFIFNKAKLTIILTMTLSSIS